MSVEVLPLCLQTLINEISDIVTAVTIAKDTEVITTKLMNELLDTPTKSITKRLNDLDFLCTKFLSSKSSVMASTARSRQYRDMFLNSISKGFNNNPKFCAITISIMNTEVECCRSAVSVLQSIQKRWPIVHSKISNISSLSIQRTTAESESLLLLAKEVYALWFAVSRSARIVSDVSSTMSLCRRRFTASLQYLNTSIELVVLCVREEFTSHLKELSQVVSTEAQNQPISDVPHVYPLSRQWQWESEWQHSIFHCFSVSSSIMSWWLPKFSEFLQVQSLSMNPTFQHYPEQSTTVDTLTLTHLRYLYLSYQIHAVVARRLLSLLWTHVDSDDTLKIFWRIFRVAQSCLMDQGRRVCVLSQIPRQSINSMNIPEEHKKRLQHVNEIKK